MRLLLLVIIIISCVIVSIVYVTLNSHGTRYLIPTEMIKIRLNRTENIINHKNFSRDRGIEISSSFEIINDNPFIWIQFSSSFFSFLALNWMRFSIGEMPKTLIAYHLIDVGLSICEGGSAYQIPFQFELNKTTIEPLEKYIETAFGNHITILYHHEFKKSIRKIQNTCLRCVAFQKP